MTSDHTLDQLARRYITGLLGVALVLGLLHVALGDARVGGVAWFDLDHERNLPTWCSGVVFFLLGCAGFTAYACERGREREHPGTFRAPWLWIGVGALGLAMSLDELTILHENLLWRELRVGTAAAGGAWAYLTQWQLLFALPVAAILLLGAAFFVNRYGASRRALVLALVGLACWLGAFTLEGLRGAFEHFGGERWYQLEVLVEEELELLGAVALLASIVRYSLDITLRLDESTRRHLARTKGLLGRRVLAVAGATLVLMGSAFALVVHYAGLLADEGAPLSRLHERALLDKQRSSIARERLLDAADAAAGYLARACDEDGQFEYRVNMDATARVRPRYNVLRHLGSIHALTQHHARRPTPEVRAAIERATSLVHRRILGPVPDHPELLAAWSRAELTRDKDPDQIKTGAVGLALVALVAVESVEPGTSSIEQLRGLGRYLLYAQKQDGSFHAKYIPSAGGLDDTWTSRYYPGEAALGLLALYSIDPDPAWLRAAARALAYLARARARQRDVPADHGSLLATAALLSDHERVEDVITDDALIEHAAQVCESILRDQQLDADAQRVFGGFDKRGRVAPTATRLVGLLAARSFLPDDREELRERVRASVEPAMRFLLESQIKTPGRYEGGIPRHRLSPGDSRPRGLDERATEIRIDSVHHALSAVLDYEAAMLDEREPSDDDDEENL